MDYFEQQIALLQEEKACDFAQHEKLLSHSTLQERRLQGVSWFPVFISNTELGRGEYLSITIQKTNFLEEGHKFRFGMSVALFSNHDPQSDRIEGVISYVGRDSMRVSIRQDELPDWARRGKLGVDLLFDAYSYREMFAALEEAKSRIVDRKSNNIVAQLLGEEPWEAVHEEENNYQIPQLNESQRLAVSAMLTERPLTILHGPPGTGKTTTLIEGIKALIAKDKKQILVVAPSNTAVDLLSERLAQARLEVVRIGNPVRVSDHLQQLTLDARIDAHQANKERKALDKQASAYLDMAHKYKRNFGQSEREQRKALFAEAKKIRKEIDAIQDYITAAILDSAEVITATLVGANHPSIRERNFHTVVIDEAGQALEPACWIPILKANRVIMAGDHCQLPPTVKSSIQSDEGLYITLFEKMLYRFPAAVFLLNVQYRMHQNIMFYPSKMFYAGQLIAAKAVANWHLIGDHHPVVFIDTAGAGYDETIEGHAISNPEEALFVYRHLLDTVTHLSERYSATELPSIGIIAPYRQQSILLKEIIAANEFLATIRPAIQTHTIDSFQGQEKDIIYISLTRSNNTQQIGFLSDIRRMNVAMTRAKKKLIVIGDSATIGSHDFYKSFLDYVTSLGQYHSVWEWMR